MVNCPPSHRLDALLRRFIQAARMLGMDLTSLSLDTVKMFAKDAAAAGFKL